MNSLEEVKDIFLKLTPAQMYAHLEPEYRRTVLGQITNALLVINAELLDRIKVLEEKTKELK